MSGVITGETSLWNLSFNRVEHVGNQYESQDLLLSVQ